MERSGLLLERANLAFSRGQRRRTPMTLCRRRTPRPRRCSPRTTTSSILNAEAVRRGSNTLHDHQAELEPQPRAGQAARRLLQAVPACRRRAVGRPSRPQLKAINTRLSTLQTAFSQKLLAAAKAGALHVDRRGRARRAVATSRSPPRRRPRRTARSRAMSLPLQNTTQQPALEFADQPRLPARRCSKPASTAPSMATPTTPARSSARSPSCAPRRRRCSAIRHWADYVLYDQMAKNRADRDRLPRPARAGRPRPRSAKRLPTSDALAKSQGATFQADARPTGISTPSRSASSATRSIATQLKPYFEFNKVLDRRRLLRRQPALRAHLQGAERHPDLEPGHAGVRGP